MTLARFGDALRRAAGVARRIVGVPDYDRYLQHVRERHPEREPMSREQFERSRLDDRYSKPGQRCC